MSAAPFCASSPEAAALSDGDFWHRVYESMTSPSEPSIGDEWTDDDDLTDRLASPCPECGAVGACAYDSEGRPMIHTNPGDAP